ncbi:MAG: deoxyguanosinetriphosphate triphosphohydrolase [Anaerocolumna sp.]|jgi:dGTPase|nr:deoxyguanosinetriphosphate triphosphohydrolase [Anaerocolumna sp.]
MNSESNQKHNQIDNKSSMRQKLEQREHEYLSPYAAFSDNSKGRDLFENPCDIRPIYQRDRDRILHSKSFRRLKHKTQVFLAPEGDHYRTRLTHTLEVSQNARTIARALRLNEDLAEAIALGHDLGHTPFGHAGERALNRVCPEGFEHHLQSIRVVELLEKHGEGLNLTIEVRDGILNHQTKGIPSTLEGKIVRLSDKIAYINHDIDDAIRGHIITEDDIPSEYTDILGHSPRERLNTIIHDIVSNSEDKNDIIMSPEIQNAMFEMRKYMFKSVYTNPVAKSEEQRAETMLEQLFTYYRNNLELLPEEYLFMIDKKGESETRVVCDYIAGMTDRYAVAKFKELTIPRSWSIY